MIDNMITPFEGLNKKQKFNSGHKNSQDSILKDLFRNYDNESVIESRIRGKQNLNSDKDSTINYQKDFREV
jgi:hypothetical protein